MTQKINDYGDPTIRKVEPFKTQLLKWIGNKQRFAAEIVSCFPVSVNTYFEPFLGSGAVLGTLAPDKAVASDAFGPLIEIWQTLKTNKEELKEWYSERWHQVANGPRVEEYERIKASYNLNPNGADLLFLCRSCYGGVVRFRQADGYMSTPCGPHNPVSPSSFANRADIWHERTKRTRFVKQDYRLTFRKAKSGDLIYCDPPYVDTQKILYGAQRFRLEELLLEIDRAKSRGVNVVLSIDGTKRSGNRKCMLAIPDGLFEREIFVNCGRSMLRRFQMGGETLEGEIVKDRLLLTY